MTAPPSSFTTGKMDVEEHSFAWTIENFPIIRTSKLMIEGQEIDFSVGSKVGHPSKWSVFLQESTVDGKKWIGIYFSIEEPSGSDPTWKNAFAEMAFVMEGDVPFNRNTGPRELATLKGYGFSQFIPAESTLERLVIKHSFKLYVPSKSIEASQVKCANQSKEDNGLLLYPSIPGNDIKVMSKDKKESAPRSSMKHVMPPSSFTTGVIDMEEQSLTWTIDNFPFISKQKSLIDQQQIYFSAGSSVGHPSRWRVHLEEYTSTADGNKWIGIYFNIVEPPASDPCWKNVFAEMEFAKQGPFPLSRGTGQMEVSTFPTTGVGRLIMAGGSTEEKLVIQNTFQLFVPSKPGEPCRPSLKEVKEVQVKFANQAKNNWDLLRRNTFPGDDIKVISKDMKEFSVQKGFLAVQSPVLEAMMRTAEVNSGVIKLPDISSRAFQIIINFLYTGELNPDWSDVEVVVELTNAAVKYQIQGFLKVLDASMGKVYKMENVLRLFKLAHQRSLQKAGVELLKFIDEKGVSSPEVSEHGHVLKAMIKNDKPEANSGKIELPGLSSTTLQAISKDIKESTSSSNMTHVIMPPSSFATGMMAVEEQSSTWTIDNFLVIGKQKSLIDAQKIYFSAGTSVGQPSKWSVYLAESTVGGKKWIGIFFRVEEPSASDPIWKNAFAEMEFVLEGPDSINRSTGQKEVATFKTGFGFNQWISAESTSERLVVKQTFKLYVPSKSTEACQSTVKELQAKFTTQAKKGLLELLLKNPITGENIKIISKDQKELTVQNWILEVHSPILKAMMKNVNLDANSGVIKFPDISARGLDVILTFLSTGDFHPDWSETKVIVELTNAAGKYQLQDLLKFLDATLGRICKVENALALFTLAHDYSLKKAEAELLKFIHEKGANSPDVYSKIQKGVSVPGGRAVVVPLPKEKSRWTLGMLFAKNGKRK